MEFNATLRSVQGSSASRRLRHAGRVPAIVYGSAQPSLNIELDHNEIFHALRKESFHASILNMKIGDDTQQVLLRDVQWHAYKQLVLHVDFQRVDASKALHTKVPLHFINAEASPAVKLSSAVITHVLTELDVICLPANLPQFIEVDLSNVIAGSMIHLADIKLPLGVTYATHGGDANPLIATVTVPAAKKGDDADAATGAETKA
jgi:large subunit ribosomal protein L25|tara:strand:+ start:433 stop:1047 length:615 start_codon:yes stop_codon:yes gene_type:complete